jgi:hypothetical protein
MLTTIRQVDTGLPFTVPVQILKPLDSQDVYYKDKSKEVMTETYLKALGLDSLLQKENES